jgi:putative aldouronate transport system substrate-binding protein
MRKKSRLGSVLISILLIGSIVGCSSANNAGSSSTQSPSAVQTDDKSQPVTISTIVEVAPEAKFRNGETIENNVFTKWAKDKFNIEFKYNWTVAGGSDTYKNKLQLMISSNEKFPDVFRVSDKQQIADLIASGKVLDLTQAIDQYASPRLKELYAKYPQAVYPITSDGKEYAVPVLSGGNVSDPVMWIRQDWLDKLGLQPPKTR